MYINQKEVEAVRNALSLVNNILEASSADPDTEEGAASLKMLNDVLDGLHSIEDKYYKQKAR